MKKIEIEHMERLEALVAKQENMIRFREERIIELTKNNVKLEGANEALTALIPRLKSS